MTVAVCLKCGQLKRGAWTPCAKCGFRPDDDESMTKHLRVTDRNYSHEQLVEIADKIKKGEEFKPEPLAPGSKGVSAEAVGQLHRTMAVGCLLLTAAFALATVALISFWLTH